MSGAELPSWVHKIDRKGADALLAGKPTGAFLVRTSDRAPLVVCVALPQGPLHLKAFPAENSITVGEGGTAVVYPGGLDQFVGQLTSLVFASLGKPLGPALYPAVSDDIYGFANPTSSFVQPPVSFSSRPTTGDAARCSSSSPANIPNGCSPATHLDLFGDSTRIKPQVRPSLAGAFGAAGPSSTDLDRGESEDAIFGLALNQLSAGAAAIIFPAHVPARLKAVIKAVKGPNATGTPVKQVQGECLVYLTPNKIHVYKVGGSDGVAFPWEPPSQLQIDDQTASSKPALVLSHPAVKATLSLAPSKDGDAKDLQAWQAALRGAQVFPDARFPLPSYFNRAPEFSAAMAERIFGSAAKKNGVAFRKVWHDYLVHPRRQGAVDRLLALCQRYQDNTDFAQAADAILSLLVAVDQQPALRCVLVAIDFKPQLVDSVVPALAVTKAAKKALTTMDDRGKFQRFWQATSELVTAAAAKDPNWQRGMANLLDYGPDFNLESEMQYSEKLATRTVQPLVITSMELYLALADVNLFRYYMAEHWVLRVEKGTERYLTLLSPEHTSDAEVSVMCDRLALEDFVPGTLLRKAPDASTPGAGKSPGKSKKASTSSFSSSSSATTGQQALPNKPRLTLADVAVLIANPNLQHQAFQLLVQRHALHNASFMSVMIKCLETGVMLHQLRNICHKYVSPDLVPDAAMVILGLLKEDMLDDQSNMLLEIVCHFLGSSETFCRPLDYWQITNNQLEVIKAKISTFAVRRFRALMDANKAWFSADSDAKTAHKQALMDGAGLNLERKAQDTLALLIGFVRLCGWPRLAHLSPVREWGQRMTVKDFRSFLVPAFRAAAAATMQTLQPNMMASVAAAIASGQLMNRPSFFSDVLVAAVDSSHAPGYHLVGDKAYLRLLSVADKLDKYDTFDLSFLVQRSNIMAILPDVQQITTAICKAVLARDERLFLQADADALPVTIPSIAQCAAYGADARSMLSDARGKHMLQQTMHHYLEFSEPSAWLSQFSKLDVIAFFLKYLLRESYDKAWEAFRSSNETNTAAWNWIQPLLNEARRNFQTAVVDPRSLSATTPEAQEALISSIEVKARTCIQPDMAFIYQFTAAWMRYLHKKSGIPMLPHNTQIICVLLFMAFYRCTILNEGFAGSENIRGRFRSLIAEVGTGEGKSVIIAMTALYFVVVHSRRVHILENNISLRDRDYNSFKDFYANFLRRDGQAVSTSKELSSIADITYVLQDDLESLHMEEAPKGNNPLAGLVLIVDEVDDLILDRPPHMSFVRSDEEYSTFAVAAFEAAKRRGSRPAGCPDKVWKEVSQGASRARTWKEGVDYAFDAESGRNRILDERGRMTNLTSSTLQFINYCAGCNDFPTVDTRYYVISTPHVFRQYDFILGVTGTVGGDAERHYVEKTYYAGVLTVPPFLDTCVDARKVHPDFRTTIIAKDHREQVNSVMKLAIEKSESVPVLIIAKTPDEARLMRDSLLRLGQLSEERVQLLVEVENGVSLKAKWASIIDRATQPVPNVLPQVWRITVTDYFGGRGHDYKVRDENVNDCGGMMVIITHIPDSRREWVQWVGRTARQDCNGQLALILDATEEFLATQAGTLESFMMQEFNTRTLVKRLLDERNKEKQDALDKAAETQHQGMVIAAICDRFYKRHGPAEPWPDTPGKKELRDLLEAHGCDVDLNTSMAFARRYGIADDFPYQKR